jgi:hypothetical protein
MNENDFIYEDYIWSVAKNEINITKHGVSFIEAASVFDDTEAAYIPDDEHSEDEKRFIVIGLSSKPRMLMVCYCEREDNSMTRIISAREADKNERIIYREYNGGKL